MIIQCVITITGLECRAVSMGQGQEVHARRSMQQCQQGVSKGTKFVTILIVTIECIGRMGAVAKLSLVSRLS